MDNTPHELHDLDSSGHPRSASIIVPTFREAANISRLVERIHAALSDSGFSWVLLLIDDNSEDGSEVVAAEQAGRLPVRMVTRRRPPRDLSRSVIEGIRLCRFDRLVVMDADLSHPPEGIADLLALLLGVLLGTLVNFLLANLYVYRQHSETPAIRALPK